MRYVRHVLKGMLIGVVPGAVMLLIAAVFSRSEWSLLIAVFGIYLTLLGAAAGGLIAYQRPPL